jgi:hypothetical protein
MKHSEEMWLLVGCGDIRSGHPWPHFQKSTKASAADVSKQFDCGAETPGVAIRGGGYFSRSS